MMERTGQHVWHAEVCRVKGELLLAQESQKPVLSLAEGANVKGQMPILSIAEGSKVEEAEACFQQAIAIAQQQRAKSWELRASVSLARLWQSQGKQAEAYQLLAEIYGWFTEGFDTAELQEAKALLDLLA